MERSSQLKIPNVVAIAGVDPSGGAGLLADVKTISALGGYACGIVTALTAQSTSEVTGVQNVPPGFIEQQMETLFRDVDICAAKIGMLSTPDTVKAVTVRASDEFSAEIAGDELNEMGKVFLYRSKDGSFTLVVFGDANAKRHVKNVEAIDVFA